jgi:uncharacterized SAM-binding protein YcdF (DUF218 family)
VVVAVAVAVGVLATLRLFVWPPVDSPIKADAVVVLAGGSSERIALGLQLMRAGVAPTLVLVGQQTELEADELCRGGQPPFELVCLLPEPDSTGTEARATAQLAAARDWRRLVLVTSTYHVTRSRMMLDRCFPGQVEAVGARPPFGFGSLVPLVAKEWISGPSR